MSGPMRITVLMGGTSSERDVSLASGIRIVQALRERGYEVKAVDPARGPLGDADERALLEAVVVKPVPPSRDELRRMAREALPRLFQHLPRAGETDVVFLALHGGYGEDGTLQSLLDLTGVPYTGSGRLGSGMALDKDVSKQLFRQCGVTTADWMMIRRGEDAGPIADRALREIGLPLIVKPSNEGSTVGLSVVKEADRLAAAIAEAFQYDDEVMIEQFIAGREFTVGILGGEALPPGEIIPKHEIYDYECKYTAGMAVEEFPAKIDSAATAQIQDQARRAFAALKLRGYARIDFRMSESGEFFCLEANTLPGMTKTSLIPQAAAAAGISFAELCDRIVQLALAGKDGERA
jgi:D-alanine-D-alanine ligase